MGAILIVNPRASKVSEEIVERVARELPAGIAVLRTTGPSEAPATVATMLDGTGKRMSAASSAKIAVAIATGAAGRARKSATQDSKESPNRTNGSATTTARSRNIPSERETAYLLSVRLYEA